MRLAAWRLAWLASNVAAFVVGPLHMGTYALARLVHRWQDCCEVRAIQAAARAKVGQAGHRGRGWRGWGRG